MATLLENIANSNPYVGANDAFINAVYKAKFGRNATQGELDRFRGTQVKDVANIVLREQSPFTNTPSNPNAPAPSATETQQQYIGAPDSTSPPTPPPSTTPPPSGITLEAAKNEISRLYREKFGLNPDQDFVDYEAGLAVQRQSYNPLQAAFETNPDAYSQQSQYSWNSWLKGPGKTYATEMSEDFIKALNDPYYEDLRGGLEYQKGLATEDLARTQARTTEAYGQNFAERGLYGSGVYQKEQGRALEDLSRGFSQTWGEGEYTPYNLRKKEIEQQQKTTFYDTQNIANQAAESAYDRYLQANLGYN